MPLPSEKQDDLELAALIASIARQEAGLEFDHFNEETAWELGALLRAEAAAKGLPIVVDIGFFHRPLFFAAPLGSTPDNVDWVRRKRNVVQRYHRSSYAMGCEMTAKGDTLARRYGLPLADFAEHGGGFPLAIKGSGVVGSVVVSGLEQRRDHMMIVHALCRIQGKDSATLALSV